MSDSVDLLLERRWQQFSSSVRELLSSESCKLGNAIPPSDSGVYLLQDEYMTYSYVGVATDLRDRIHKHVSGDEGHAIQRAYSARFPDRSQRRQFIKENVNLRWLLIPERTVRDDMERLLIWLIQPVWNRR